MTVIARILLWLLVLSTRALGQVVQLEGFVRDTVGNPIKDVYIIDFGKTDDAGHFVLRNDTFFKFRKAILFTAKGYKPTPVLLDASRLDFDVTMETESSVDTWNFPKCSGVGSEFRQIGTFLRLTIPKKYQFKTGIDTDYKYFVIGFRDGKETRQMRGGLGPTYAGPYPSAEDVLQLSSYTYRRTSTGTDWKGITKSGHFWRYMGSVSAFETYHYETESKAAADAFDLMIDSACFDAQPSGDK